MVKKFKVGLLFVVMVVISILVILATFKYGSQLIKKTYSGQEIAISSSIECKLDIQTTNSEVVISGDSNEIFELKSLDFNSNEKLYPDQNFKNWYLPETKVSSEYWLFSPCKKVDLIIKSANGERLKIVYVPVIDIFVILTFVFLIFISVFLVVCSYQVFLNLIEKKS